MRTGGSLNQDGRYCRGLKVPRRIPVEPLDLVSADDDLPIQARKKWWIGQ